MSQDCNYKNIALNINCICMFTKFYETILRYDINGSKINILVFKNSRYKLLSPDIVVRYDVSTSTIVT